MKKINQAKINIECERLHFFKVVNSDKVILSYKFVNMDKIFPAPRKYDRSYYFQGQ